MRKRLFSAVMPLLLFLLVPMANFAQAQSCPTQTLPWPYGVEELIDAQTKVPSCWGNINEGTNAICAWSTKTGRDAHTGNTTFYFKGFQNATIIHRDWLMTPSISFTGNDEISFWVKTGVASTAPLFHGRFAIYASTDLATDINDTANYMPLTITGANVIDNRVDFAGKDWQKITIQLPSTLTGDHHLAFLVDKNSYTFYLDDIYFYSVSSCETPDDVHLTKLTATTADFAWTSNAGSFTVYCDTLGVAMSDAYSEVAYDNHISFSDLLPNKTYQIMVEASCSDGVLSVPSYPILLKTPCAPITSDELPFYEDFSDNEVGVNSQLDPCWIKGTNATMTKYPFVKKNYGRDDDTSLMFMGTTSSYSYAVLPIFDDDVSSFVLSCSIRHATQVSKSSDLLLGLMSNPYDISTFTAFDTLSPSTTVEWSDFVINMIDYNSDSGQFIAFKMAEGQAGEAFLDNIQVALNASSCDSPIEPVVDMVAATSVDISWTDSIGSQWRVYYGAPNFDTAGANHIDVASTSATILDLNPQTAYEFLVVTDCGNGEYSMPTPRVAFTTTCAAIATLPYIEDFESYESGEMATINPCWIKHCSDPTQHFPYPDASAAINGQNGLWLQAYETTVTQYNSYVALPMFAEEITNLKLKFKMKNQIFSNHSSEPFSKIAVGLMTNPNDLTTFDTLQIFDMITLPSGTVQSQEVAFNNYDGTGKYITFLALDVYKGEQHFAENNVYVDDIEVTLIPQCPTPTDITVTDATGSTIDLTWSGDAQNFSVMYSSNEDMSDSIVVTANTNSIQLTDLNSYTYYYIKLASLCGGIQSEWTLNPIKVRTEMDCGFGFENYVDTIGHGTTANMTDVINGNYMQTNTTNWSIFTSAEMIAMGLNGNDNQIHAISLQTKTVNEPTHIRIYMANAGNEDFNADCSDTIALDEMTLVYDNTLQFVANSWNEIVLNTPFHYNADSSLMIAFERDDRLTANMEFYTNVTPAYRTVTTFYIPYNMSSYHSRKTARANMVFNICGNIPNCVRPSNIAITSLASDAISLSWEGTSASYQLAYATENFNPDSITDQTLTTISGTSTMVGATPNTTYYIYVRSICSGSYSDWSVLTVVTTPCDAIEVPYTENFDTYAGSISATGGQIINPCWVKATNNATSAYPYVYSRQSASAPNSFFFRATSYAYSYAALPMFTEPLSNLSVSFKLYNTDEDHAPICVGVMTNPYDLSTFHGVDTLKPSAIEEWQMFDVAFNEYDGEGSFIAFLMPQQTTSFSDMYLDDVEVYITPSCVAPKNVRVTNVAGNSAIIAWNDPAEYASNNYELQYGVHGFALGTGTIISSSENPTTIIDLQSNTEYDVYVRAICSDTDSSRWSMPVTFMTPCGMVALPVEYDFETFDAGFGSSLPACFYRYNDATGSYSKNNPSINKLLPNSNAHSGTNYIQFRMVASASSATNAGFIFPMIDTVTYPIVENQMSFWGRASSTAEVFVGIMKDPADLNTLVIIDSIDMNSVMTQYFVSFESFQGHGAYPAIFMRREVAAQTAYIDDVRIEEAPVCPVVYDLQTLGVTNNSATIAWTDTIGSTSWEVEYKDDESADYTVVTVQSNPCILNNLVENTHYTFNVRAICSTGEATSPARIAGSFYTSQVPASLPYNYDFETADEWSYWQTITNGATNWYRGSNVAAQGSNALYVSNDEGATRSSSWNSVVNATTYRDINFGTDTSMFTMTFKANVGGQLDSNIQLAVMLVDPFLAVNSSSENMITPWGPLSVCEPMITIRQDTTWNTFTVHFDNVAGVKRVAFYWYNPNTGNADIHIDKAAAIDDIAIVEQNCFRPSNLNATNITVASATLNWEGSATNYEVAYRAEGDVDAITQMVASNSLDIANLLSNTDYHFMARSICGVGDTSDWSDEAIFTTLCGRFLAADTIREDFTYVEGTSHNKQGELPDCWEAYTNGALDIAPHVVDSGYIRYTHDGKALAMSAGMRSHYGRPSVVRLPYTVEPINTLKLSYWMCTESSAAGALEVGYLTGDNFETDFVAVRTVPASLRTKHTTVGDQADGVGFYDTVYFESVPDIAQAVAFRWSHDTSTTSVCIDDVELTIAEAVCVEPIIQSVVVDHESASITWTGVNTDYQLSYKESTATDWSNNIDVSGTNYLIDNLLPETEYMVRLRTNCQEGNFSDWVDTSFTTLERVCIVPTNLTATAGQNEIIVDWNAAEGQSAWEVSISDGEEVIVEVNEHPTTIDALAPATEYTVKVRAVCDVDFYSDWSEAITITTEAEPICNGVNDVHIYDVTDHSAMVNWTPGGDELEWELEYGVAGFVLNEGIRVTVTSSDSEYFIENLDEETSYDVYIRALCGEDFYSEWSEKKTFTTLASTPEGIDGIDGNFQFAIYPNPTQGSTTISLNGIEGKVIIHVVDMNGRIMATETIECGSDCEKRLDADGLPQGTYFVRVLGDNVNSVRKLIVK